MRISRKQIPQIILLAVVILSTISLVEATASQVSFYNAITNFQLQVKSVEIAPGQESLNVTVNVEASNPTSYGRLHLKSILGTFYYEGENHTIVISPGGPRSGSPYQSIETRWWELPQAETDINRPMQPYSVEPALLSLMVQGDSARTFLEYFDKQGRRPEDIRWQLDLSVILDTPTFLGTITLEYESNQ